MYTYVYNLKVEVTRFEDLEETHAEVKLKQSLWESQKEWARDYDTWMMVGYIALLTNCCDTISFLCFIISD